MGMIPTMCLVCGQPAHTFTLGGFPYIALCKEHEYLFGKEYVDEIQDIYDQKVGEVIASQLNVMSLADKNAMKSGISYEEYLKMDEDERWESPKHKGEIKDDGSVTPLGKCFFCSKVSVSRRMGDGWSVDLCANHKDIPQREIVINAQMNIDENHGDARDHTIVREYDRQHAVKWNDESLPDKPYEKPPVNMDFVIQHVQETGQLRWDNANKIGIFTVVSAVFQNTPPKPLVYRQFASELEVIGELGKSNWRVVHTIDGYHESELVVWLQRDVTIQGEWK